MDHTPFLIREYEETDANQVMQCIVALQDFEHKLYDKMSDGKSIASQYLKLLLEDLEDQDGKIFVAEVGGKVVGYVHVHARVKNEEIIEIEHEWAEMQDLAVLEEYRGMGIGKALIKRAEEYARQKGATEMRTEVLALNTAGRRLYSTVGFSEHLIVVRKSLQEQQ